MNLKIYFLITVIATITFQSFASGSIEKKQILIPNGQVDENKYEFYLSQHHQFIRPTDYFAAMAYDTNKQTELRYSFIQAKQAYLDHKFYQAQSIFRKIIGQANKSHWDYSSKKIILTSLALNIELTSNSKEKSKYIQQLGGLFPEFDLNELNLELNLRKEIDQLKEQYWTVTRKTWPYTHAIINGIHHSLFPGKKIRIPRVEFLITLLSNRHLPITFATTKNKLFDFQPIAKTMVKGDCDAYSFNFPERLRGNSFYLYFNDQCVLNQENNKKFNSNKFLEKNVDLKVSSLPKAQTPEQVIQTNLNRKREPNRWKWLKNKWVWAGLSAAIVGYKIIENNRKKNNDLYRPLNEPTTATTSQNNPPSVKEGW